MWILDMVCRQKPDDEHFIYHLPVTSENKHPGLHVYPTCYLQLTPWRCSYAETWTCCSIPSYAKGAQCTVQKHWTFQKEKSAFQHDRKQLIITPLHIMDSIEAVQRLYLSYKDEQCQDDLEQLVKPSSQVGWCHLWVVDWHRHWCKRDCNALQYSANNDHGDVLPA